MSTTRSDPDWWYFGRQRQADIDANPDAENYLAREVHEDEFNPDHQGFIGFVPPKEGPMHPIEKSARRIAAELVLTPPKLRPKKMDGYTEEYLKKTSGCAMWPRLRCAMCDCWKMEDPL